MGEYIRDSIIWITTAIVATFSVYRTGDINSLGIFIAPVAAVLFKELFTLL